MSIAFRQPTQAAATKLAEARTSERDENQRGLDTAVLEMVKNWNAAGQPAPGAEGNAPLPLGVTKDERTAGKEMVRRAFRYVNTQEYKAAPKNKAEAAWYEDSDPDDDGIITIAFAVRPLTVKTDDNGQPVRRRRNR